MVLPAVKALRAALLLHSAAAISHTCKTAENPRECLSINNGLGMAACTWLILKGRCTDAGGLEGMASPVQCCASNSPFSACTHSVKDADFTKDGGFKDGMCSIAPANSTLLKTAAVPSLNEMKRMMHLSFAVYCPGSQINDWSCGEHCSAVSGISEQKYIFNSDMQTAGFVGWDAEATNVVVVFRGTVNSKEAFIADWSSNLDFFKTSPFTKYPAAEVHQGFWGVWQAMKGDVIPNVHRVLLSHPDAPVRVAGHSLGAAVATHAAVDMKVNYGWITSVVNFGSPRPGDHEYHQVIAEHVPHWRVTHHHDLVAHVPPQWAGFYHGATEIFFPNEHGLHYRVCDGSGEDSNCANTCGFWSCNSISDHFNYLDMEEVCATDSIVV